MPSMELTRRGKVLMLVPIYLFTGAYLLKNPFMALTGAGLLALLLHSRIYLDRVSSKVDVDPSIAQDTLYVGEGVKVSYMVGSERPLNISLEPSDDLENREDVRFEQTLNSKAIFESTLYPTSSGRAEVGGLKGTLSDPMGLYKVQFDHQSPIDMVVYPSKDAIRYAKTYAHRVHLEELVKDMMSFTVSSGELEEIREYHPGDRWRDIHWRSVSKLGNYMTKEYEKMALLECTVFLDMSPSMRRGKKKMDHINFLTLELLKELELSGHDIGMTVYDHRKVLFHQKPEQRRATFTRIYRALSDLPDPKEPAPYNSPRYREDITIENLKDAERQFVERVSTIRYGSPSAGLGGLVEAVKEVKRGVHKRSLVMIITDMETNPEITIKSVEKLKNMNHTVWVIIPFSPWYDLEHIDEDVLEMTYKDYIRLEKISKILYRAGAKVFEMYPGKEGLRILEEGR